MINDSRSVISKGRVAASACPSVAEVGLQAVTRFGEGRTRCPENRRLSRRFLLRLDDVNVDLMSDIPATSTHAIVNLRLRVSTLKRPDPGLGVDLSSLVDCLAPKRQSSPPAAPSVDGQAGLADPTSSLDAAFDLLDRVHPDASFMFYAPDGPGKPMTYHLDKVTPSVVFFGEGWTRHACVLDAILHALDPRAGIPKPEWNCEAEEITLFPATDPSGPP